MRAILLLGLLLPLEAEAAWPTKVLSAVEKEKSIPDIHLELTYDRLSKNARITREWIQEENGQRTALDVRELDFHEITQRLLIALRIGIYRDLELHIVAPVILQNDSDIRFAEGVESRSTIYGSINADDPAYDYRFPITQVPAERERAGFGDMTFGLSFSPFVERKDEAWPTLTLRGDIIAPTGKRRDPSDPNSLPGGKAGSVGLGQTIFDLSIGLSKRMSSTTPTLDPYIIFGARIPVPTSSQKAIGMDPSPSGRFLVGTELIMWQDFETSQFYTLDFAFGFRYVGIGRTFSELSDYLPNFNQRTPRRFDDPAQPRDTFIYEDYQDPANYNNQDGAASCGAVSGTPCGELTRVDEHLEMDGTVAVHIQPIEYVLIRAGVTLGIVSDHLITAESVGSDRDGPEAENQVCNGAPCVGRVNAVNNKGEDERSQYYDPRYDTPGRRFRAEDIMNFTFFVTAAATF
jgi:hypothetical protein